MTWPDGHGHIAPLSIADIGLLSTAFSLHDIFMSGRLSDNFSRVCRHGRAQNKYKRSSTGTVLE